MRIREFLILVALGLVSTTMLLGLKSGSATISAADQLRSVHQGDLVKLNDYDSSPSELRTRMLTR
jgi:hypothetical protein